MPELIDKALEMKIIPVTVIHDADNAEQLGDALIAGGLPCAEITFRTPAAAEAISKLARKRDMLVGAGTILTLDQVKQAADAGARFMVSPGLNPKVVTYCLDRGISVIPGVATPTDIETGLDLGLELFKFFPAEAFGGLKTLKAISAPYNRVKFVPTGGINADNLVDYLKHPAVAACGGSWMVKSDLIAQKQFDRITQLTAEAVSLVQKLCAA